MHGEGGEHARGNAHAPTSASFHVSVNTVERRGQTAEKTGRVTPRLEEQERIRVGRWERGPVGRARGSRGSGSCLRSLSDPVLVTCRVWFVKICLAVHFCVRFPVGYTSLESSRKNSVCGRKLEIPENEKENGFCRPYTSHREGSPTLEAWEGGGGAGNDRPPLRTSGRACGGGSAVLGPSQHRCGSLLGGCPLVRETPPRCHQGQTQRRGDSVCLWGAPSSVAPVLGTWAWRVWDAQGHSGAGARVPGHPSWQLWQP